MKTAFVFAAFLGALSVQAQTNSTLLPPTPALTPGTVTVPGSLAIPQTTPAPVATTTPTPVTTTPGTGALATPGVVNPSPPLTVTNLNTRRLTTLLANLQNAVSATLPTLNAFNDNFDFLSTGVNGAGSTASLVTTNFGIPFGANATTVTGTAATNNFGIPPGLVTFPASRDTLRALLVLQNDLQRLLPQLEALNGGTNFPGPEPTFGFMPEPVTNLFLRTGP